MAVADDQYRIIERRTIKLSAATLSMTGTPASDVSCNGRDTVASSATMV
jgi:hypothetical protein